MYIRTKKTVDFENKYNPSDFRKL